MRIETEDEIFDREDDELGSEIIKLLGLTVKSNGRVDTEWGDKTPRGLVRTLRRVLEGE